MINRPKRLLSFDRMMIKLSEHLLSKSSLALLSLNKKDE